MDQKPPSAPVCWSRQYDENDKECINQCEYRMTCKPAFYRSNSMPQGAISLPMYQPQQPTTFWQGSPQPPAQPMPFSGFQVPQPQRVQPPPLPVFQPQSIPTIPNPVAMAPSIPALAQVSHPNHIVQQAVHSPFFMQYYTPYPGETVTQRLMKHMALRLGQVLFSELANFLGLWKWPPITK